tara:strand:- start:359 stop:499 length:141 start_codon:yes stop_codon:yes gene_type:complete
LKDKRGLITRAVSEIGSSIAVKFVQGVAQRIFWGRRESAYRIGIQV